MFFFSGQQIFIQLNQFIYEIYISHLHLMDSVLLNSLVWASETEKFNKNLCCLLSTLTSIRVEALLTICECVEGFASNIQSSEGRTLGLGGPPAGQSSLKGRRPITDHSKGLPLHRDDLTSLGFWGVGVRLGNWPLKETQISRCLETMNKGVTWQ